MNKSIEKLSILNRTKQRIPVSPEKIVQFGTGAFLKGFINWIVQRLNEETALNAGIVAIKLRRGNEALVDKVNQQQGLFTLNTRGLVDGEVVDKYSLITCQNRALSPYDDFEGFMCLAESPTLQWVISNTTEAGIVFNGNDKLKSSSPESFPAKLTLFLHRRYVEFDGDVGKGLRIFCCELIEDNAMVLRKIILQYTSLWNLDKGFVAWLTASCQFHNTLVDRIVTGSPSAERLIETQSALGYCDSELIESESYYQWVIEVDSKNKTELSAIFEERVGLNVILADDLALYRQRKIRILNGAHTGCVSAAVLLGLDTVYQGACDKGLSVFMRRMVFDDICPTISLPSDEVKKYADGILERFSNPFLKHEWKDIALNSLGKWRTRLLPVLAYWRSNERRLPDTLVTSLSCLILLYRGEYLDKTYVLRDDDRLLEVMRSAWELFPRIPSVVTAVLSDEEAWGQNLALDTGLVNGVAERIKGIQENGLSVYMV